MRNSTMAGMLGSLAVLLTVLAFTIAQRHLFLNRSGFVGGS